MANRIINWNSRRIITRFTHQISANVVKELRALSGDIIITKYIHAYTFDALE
jgi:hypothetical protein